MGSQSDSYREVSVCTLWTLTDFKVFFVTCTTATSNPE